MYLKAEDLLQFENFHPPFGGRLRSDNRWVRLAKIIPWAKLEEQYAANFAKSGMGAPAKPVRMALGALIIKEKCDRRSIFWYVEIFYNRVRLHSYLDYKSPENYERGSLAA